MLSCQGLRSIFEMLRVGQTRFRGVYPSTTFITDMLRSSLALLLLFLLLLLLLKDPAGQLHTGPCFLQDRPWQQLMIISENRES